MSAQNSPLANSQNSANKNNQPRQRPEAGNIKSFMESYAYQRANAELQAEINAYPVDINYKVFAKTAQEKLAAKVAISQYKLSKTQPV